MLKAILVSFEEASEFLQVDVVGGGPGADTCKEMTPVWGTGCWSEKGVMDVPRMQLVGREGSSRGIFCTQSCSGNEREPMALPYE